MINKNIDLCGFIVDNANDINKDAGKMTYKYVGNPTSLFCIFREYGILSFGGVSY